MLCAGLFAGIGGVERGLELAGHSTVLLCENDAAATRVLRRRFPQVAVFGDVRELDSVDGVDLVTAGFPCQDLSPAGRTAGIQGSKSSLVKEVFRLVDKDRPPWLLLENVPFMLRLRRGSAMAFLVSELRRLKYSWAYRVVDTRAFGLPQRRRRVLLLASRDEDPRPVLLGDEAHSPPEKDDYSDFSRRLPLNQKACGFYWTEGTRGLGWAIDATPTLKGGSNIGIPSPPAIVLPTGDLVIPDIRDAERLQGFPPAWTRPALAGTQRGMGQRWRLVGNAVSVPVARWIGKRLLSPAGYDPSDDLPLRRGEPWPSAAWRMDGRVHLSSASSWPKRFKRRSLAEFLKYPTRPLPLRAARGFLGRIEKSSLRLPEGFLEVVDAHVARMGSLEEAGG